MPDELTEELIRQREETRSIKRQLGELAKVTGIQTQRTGTIKVIVKRVQVNVKNIAGTTLIWDNIGLGNWDEYNWAAPDNPLYWSNVSQGIWGTNQWSSGTVVSFILGNSTAGILGSSRLGETPAAWVEHYDSGDLE
jgi:hypothetical protein